MKRMYVTLIILFSLLFWAVTSFGQKKTDPTAAQMDSLQKRMQLREEIHKRMMDKLLHGIGDDADLFKDLEQMMNESMQDAISDMNTFQSQSFSHSFSGSGGSHFSTEWSQTSEGKVLTITPKSPEQKLDINVQNDFITIQGKSESKNSQASFSSSFNVPNDCDSAKVKMSQKDGKIVMVFPYKVAKKFDSPGSTPKKEERIPIEPGEDDVTI